MLFDKHWKSADVKEEEEKTQIIFAQAHIVNNLLELLEMILPIFFLFYVAAWFQSRDHTTP